jgi:outer membrane protein
MIEAALLAALGEYGMQSPADGLPPLAQEAAELENNAIRERDVQNRWFARTGIAGALYNSGATIAVGGVVVPGATVHIDDDVTAMLDIGYNISDRLSVQVMVGIPPRASATGKGTVAPFGILGAVRLAPVIATAVYRFPEYRGFRPYVGAGGTYVFILKNYDGAVTELDVGGNWGIALQAGLEYRVSRRLELFADYKRLWVKVRAEGMLGPAPVRARVTLDPDVISAGVKLNFR